MTKEIESYKKKIVIDAKYNSKYVTICNDLERTNNILSNNKAAKDELNILTELNTSLNVQLKKAADKTNTLKIEHQLNIDKMMKKLRDESNCVHKYINFTAHSISEYFNTQQMIVSKRNSNLFNRRKTQKSINFRRKF